MPQTPGELPLSIMELISVQDDMAMLYRRNPMWLFGPQAPNPERLVEVLVSEALALGAREIRVRIENLWFAVGASLDWLSVGTEVPPQQQFRIPLGLPEQGVNLLRAEFLVPLFAPDVVTVSAKVAHVVQGSWPTPAWLRDGPFASQERIVAFRWADGGTAS